MTQDSPGLIFSRMIKSSARYHDTSSYDRHKMTGHYLDWQNQPRVFKDYPETEPVLLPQDIQLPDEKLSALILEARRNRGARKVNVRDLSSILRLTCALTAKARHPGGDFYFRSVASAGALYPTEIYVATRGLKNLEDGLYHFGLRRHSLTPIRARDLTPAIIELAQLPDKSAPALTFFMTAIFFRSAWKYRGRAYRYHLLDTGHVIEHLVLALKVLGLPANLTYDFDDNRANHLLGLDDNREVTLGLAHVIEEDALPGREKPIIEDLPDQMLNASRVSDKEIDYPAIREMHQAGTTLVPPATMGTDMIHELGIVPASWTACSHPSPWPERLNYADALFHRRSRRNFVKEPISKDYVASLIDSLCAKDNTVSDMDSTYRQSVCIGFLAAHVRDMNPGFYSLDIENKSTALVQPGSFTKEMAHISLDQAWLENASLHFLFLSNMEIIDRTWGPRGYRYAMLQSGRLGERLYIAATAMGLGCCGIGAFYDWEAAELLGLNKTSRLLYLLAVGAVKKDY